MNLAACGALPRRPETQVWFRAIQPQFWTTSLATAQTKVIPSRFNAGATASPQFEILYLAENPMVALFEVQALFGTPTQPGSVIPHPRQAWITVNVTVQLQAMVDLTEVATYTLLETSAQELTGDWRGYQQRGPLTSVSQPVGLAPTQDLGAALFGESGLEGFRTFSARLPYHSTLIVFPEKLQPGSTVAFHHPYTGQQYVIRP
jgi:RES domain-containing protein